MQIDFYGVNDPIARESFIRAVSPLSPEEFRVSVSFNHDPKDNLPIADYRVLLLWEPSAVMPWQYKEKNRSKFDLVIPMSSWRARNLGYHKFSFHPYQPSGELISPWRSRSRRIVMINSAKFSASPRSNYGLRRRTSKALNRARVGYVLFGSNWKMPFRLQVVKRAVAMKNSLIARERLSFRESFSELLYRFPEYKGHIEDKNLVLRDSELSLVIENESDWITEKLFDSICCGSVPVFVGPDLSSEFPELENCVIRIEPDPQKIVQRVATLTDQEVEKKKRAIENYLKISGQRGLDFWRPSELWARTAKIVGEALTRNSNR